MRLGDLLKNKYVLCLCEGRAEMDIMNLLIENNKLIFSREDLIERKFHYRQKVSAIEERFLGLSYDKDLVILRIIDSKREQFNLSKAYRDRFMVVNTITNPEIEILIIIDSKDLDLYLKVKSKIKPSEFCKNRYSFKNIKKAGFMDDYFKDVDYLIDALKIHKKKFGAESYSIFDLLK